LVRIADALSQQIALARNVERRTEDPTKKNAINTACVRAEGVLRELREGIGKLERNPNDSNTHRELETTLKEVKSASKALGAAVNLPGKNPEKKILATGASLNADLVVMVGAVKKGDRPVAERLLPVIERKMGSQARGAKALASTVDNPDLKGELGRVADAQQRLIPQFVSAARNAIDNPQNQQAVANFEKVAGEVKKVNDDMMNAARRVEKGEGASSSKVNMDKVTSMEGAALAVKEATRERKVDGTPKGKIIGASKRIAELMELLSKAGKAGDKKGMIAAAREISAASMDIVNNANVLAAACKDEGTRDHLMSMAYAAKNFGIQLKILAAVKSATEGTDKTTETQLLTCSKGLAGSVIQTISYADVADLKKK